METGTEIIADLAYPIFSVTNPIFWTTKKTFLRAKTIFFATEKCFFKPKSMEDGAHHPRHSPGSSSTGPARANHRKKPTIRTAGMIGAHHAFKPSAAREVGPSVVMANMMALAHAIALIKLRLENRIGEIPAYAHAMGIAILNPGKKRNARMNFVACLRMRD